MNKQTKYKSGPVRLTFYMRGGVQFTIDKVLDWEVQYNSEEDKFRYLRVKQDDTARRRLIVASTDLTRILAIVET